MKLLINRLPKKTDIVNSMVNSKGFQDVIGQKIFMTGYAIYEKDDVETEEIKTITVVKSNDNVFYSSIGQTVRNSIEAIDMLDLSDDELAAGVVIEICQGVSKGNRKFVYATIVEE